MKTIEEAAQAPVQAPVQAPAAIALVQCGMLVAKYGVDQQPAAERAARLLTLAGGRQVDLYEVGAAVTALPRLGTEVVPGQLGWRSLDER